MNLFIVQAVPQPGMPSSHRLYAVVAGVPPDTTYQTVMDRLEDLDLTPVGEEGADWFLVREDEVRPGEYPKERSTRVHDWQALLTMRAPWRWIHVHVRDAERKRILQGALSSGTSMSGYVRDAVNERLERQGIV